MNKKSNKDADCADLTRNKRGRNSVKRRANVFILRHLADDRSAISFQEKGLQQKDLPYIAPLFLFLSPKQVYKYRAQPANQVTGLAGFDYFFSVLCRQGTLQTNF